MDKTHKIHEKLTILYRSVLYVRSPLYVSIAVSDHQEYYINVFALVLITVNSIIRASYFSKTNNYKKRWYERLCDVINIVVRSMCYLQRQETVTISTSYSGGDSGSVNYCILQII